jgi:hypothetical protein
MYRLTDRKGRSDCTDPHEKPLAIEVVHKDMIRVRDFSLQYISIIVPPFRLTG